MSMKGKQVGRRFNRMKHSGTYNKKAFGAENFPKAFLYLKYINSRF